MRIHHKHLAGRVNFTLPDKNAGRQTQKSVPKHPRYKLAGVGVYYEYGYTTKEISRLLSLSEPRVKRILTRLERLGKHTGKSLSELFMFSEFG